VATLNNSSVIQQHNQKSISGGGVFSAPFSSTERHGEPCTFLYEVWGGDRATNAFRCQKKGMRLNAAANIVLLLNIEYEN